MKAYREKQRNQVANQLAEKIKQTEQKVQGSTTTQGIYKL